MLILNKKFVCWLISFSFLKMTSLNCIPLNISLQNLFFKFEKKNKRLKCICSLEKNFTYSRFQQFSEIAEDNNQQKKEANA